MKAKSAALILLAAVLLLISLSPAFAEEDTAIRMDHFTLTLPGSWICDDSSGPDQLKYFKNQKGSPSGGYFMVTQYTDLITENNESSVSAFFLGLRSGFQDSSIDKQEDHEELMIDGNRSIIINYTALLGGQNLRCCTLCSISGTNGILILYVNSDLSAEETEKAFDGIVATIHCTD